MATTQAAAALNAAIRPALGHRAPIVRNVPVARIRPEDGLGRKRDRDGHRELQRSIERFGVLTPITVRPAPDGTGDFLLVKGQGRTLACRLLGIDMIPAVVVAGGYAETEKVQQFLVENVARLKMRPVDRAMLIKRARHDGEETAKIARRFGISASTVRRLLAQLDGVTAHEVEALRAGEVSLAVHAVIARHVDPSERLAVVEIVSRSRITAKEAESLFRALGWKRLVELGDAYRHERLVLLNWACGVLGQLAPAPTEDRLSQLALQFPVAFARDGGTYRVVGQ